MRKEELSMKDVKASTGMIITIRKDLKKKRCRAVIGPGQEALVEGGSLTSVHKSRRTPLVTRNR